MGSLSQRQFGILSARALSNEKAIEQMQLL
jgi:hypothetical protein